jgi:hypothetical protein
LQQDSLPCPYVSARLYKQRSDSDEDLLVLGVRLPKDCVGEQDRIPGSRNIPVEEIEARPTELDDYLERSIAIVTNHAFFLASSSESLINHAGRHAFSKLTRPPGRPYGGS